MNKKYDVIIIGGGLSGLAAGIRLAYFDKKVCIIEKHSLLGGLNSYYYKSGHYFDVGLHAMTNYISSSKSRRAPLAKLLRQLRVPLENLELCPQKFSRIHFGDTKLDFTNELDFFDSQVAEKFPKQIDNFRKLVRKINGYDELSLQARPKSAKEVVCSIIDDPLLVDMLFCPLMFYGSSVEHNMEFGQFCIMFKSIFQEGFCRPKNEMKKIIKMLAERYVEL